MGYKTRIHFCQPCLVIFLLVLLSAISFAQENPKDSKKLNEGQKKPANLVDKIRRQLMKDNYDYFPDDETTLPTGIPTQDEEIADVTETPLDPWPVVADSNKLSDQPDQDPNQGPPYGERSNNFVDLLNYPDDKQDEQRIDSNKLPQRQQNVKSPIMFFDQGQKNNDQQTDPPDYRDRSLDQNPNDINKSQEPRGHSAEDLDNNNNEDAVENANPKLSTRKQDYGSSAEEVKPTTGQYDKQNYDGDIMPHTLDPTFDMERGFSVSQHDLLYYIDDKRMRRKGDDDNMVSESSGESEDSEQDTIQSTTRRSKYKLIKMKSAGASRRNMALRRFVEEKNAEGVAIFRLDDEPFPQFLLPRQRRQYMWGDLDQGNQTDSNISNTSS